MKKILVLLLMVTTLAAYSQNSDEKVLSTVNTVKPKPGQKMAFGDKPQHTIQTKKLATFKPIDEIAINRK